MDNKIGSFGSQPYPIDSNRRRAEAAPEQASTAPPATPQPDLAGDHFRFSAVRDGEAQAGNSTDVTSLYQKLLGRAPSQKEIDRWSGFDLAEVEKYIKRGTEYRVGVYGETVKAVFRDLLGRIPTEMEMDRYTDMLADGTSESQIRKKIDPTLTIKSGLNRLQIDEANAAVGNAPGAAKITGDVTAITDTDSRDFTKGAIVSKTTDGAQYTQYASNGVSTVRTEEGGLVYQNPKEKKLVVYTAEGWAVEAKIAQYDGVDQDGLPATKNYVQLKVTDPNGNVRLDRTKPAAANRSDNLQMGGGLVDCTTDRKSGAINDLSISLPGMKVTFSSEGDSSVKVASRSSDGDGSTMKYRADNFETTMSGLGRAYYDSNATEPELPKIPTPSEPWTPTTTAGSTTPTNPTTPVVPAPTPTISVTPAPTPLEPSGSGVDGELIGTVGRIANSAYQSTMAAKPIVQGIGELIHGEGAVAAAETAEGASELANLAEGAEVAKPAVSTGFMAGLKGLLRTVGKATMISGLIEGGISLVENASKIYKGEESTGKAIRNVATDTTTGALTGGLAATASGLTTTLLTTLGVLGGPIGILAAAGVGMATYWLARGPIRNFFAKLFGADQPETMQNTATP